MKQLAELVTKASQEATNTINTRMLASIDEIKAMALKVKQEEKEAPKSLTQEPTHASFLKAIWMEARVTKATIRSSYLRVAHGSPDGARLRLSRRRGRLVQPPGSGLAAVDHPGGRVLSRGGRGGARPSTASRRSSTPTRAVSSPAPTSPACC